MRECPRCERCFADEVLVCPEDNKETRRSLPGGTMLAGRYLLEKRLGRGAMGQVYLARDENLVTRRVAVKTVRPDILNDEEMQEGEAIARFEREARTAASIQHPNVVDVTDFGKTPEGVFFLVMEYVEGETLHHLLRREGTLSAKRALVLLRQVAEGVEAAHDAGILHRDLKPANIFIMQKKRKSGAAGNGGGFVKVGDFGLAKIVSDAAAEAISASGPASRGIIGTPEYMAPEQMQPGAALDARADVYAIGTIAYHMLGGRPPFTGDLPQLIMQKMMNAPPPLSGLRSDISPEVEHAVMHALERDVEKRSPNVAEWLEEFETAVGDESEDEQGDSRVVILAPSGAEVYVDDERQGSIGRSGRVILNSIPPGRHVLRVARSGEMDDERVIEIRPGSGEQVIQAQLRQAPTPSQFTPSRGGPASGIGSGPHSSIPGVVVCGQCSARFAAGARFCGRCGSTVLYPVTDGHGGPSASQTPVSRPGGAGQSSGGSQGGGAGRSIGGQPGYASGVSGHNVSPPPGVLCSSCGATLPAGTKFCGRCGTTVPSGGGSASQFNAPRPVQIICRQCSTSYPPGTKFCGRCGTVI
ncbi:MAG TPA: protein kinase [Pyrinomonadaceae bacterium]|jgi:serine/threonine protein kinase/ribosomal protein L40E